MRLSLRPRRLLLLRLRLWCLQPCPFRVQNCRKIQSDCRRQRQPRPPAPPLPALAFLQAFLRLQPRQQLPNHPRSPMWSAPLLTRRPYHPLNPPPFRSPHPSTSPTMGPPSFQHQTTTTSTTHLPRSLSCPQPHCCRKLLKWAPPHRTHRCFADWDWRHRRRHRPPRVRIALLCNGMAMGGRQRAPW